MIRTCILTLCAIVAFCPLWAQVDSLPLYQQDLYVKRSSSYNISMSILRSILKTRRKRSQKRGESEKKDEQWFPKRNAYRHFKVSKESIQGRTLYALTPKEIRSSKVILYYHGGGYQTGPYNPQWHFLSSLAEELGCVAYLVDYRLAPQHPFPAGLDDGYAAYLLLADRHGGENVLLFGDSAGGGMCLAVSQMARQDKKAMPYGLILLSPWLRPGHTDARKWEIAPNDPILAPDSSNKGSFNYSPDGDFQNPLISPYFASLEAMPPMLLLIGTYDILYPECMDFIQRAKEEKHPLAPIIAKEMCHVWPIGIGVYPEAKRAILQMAAWVEDLP